MHLYAERFPERARFLWPAFRKNFQGIERI